MQWCCRVREAINNALPFLVSTQATNLALLVSAILKKQTLCLSELAGAYPIPNGRRVGAPKHCLLHRLKRLWRFTANERVNATEVRLALLSHTIFRLGYPGWVSSAIDWTMFDTTLPIGERIRYPGFCASPSHARDALCRFCRWPMTGSPAGPKKLEPDRTGRAACRR